jgi:polyphosphate kinase
LETQLRDNVKAREMRPDGSYVRRTPAEGEAPLRAQVRFMEAARERARASTLGLSAGPFRLGASGMQNASQPPPSPMPGPTVAARKKAKKKPHLAPRGG